MTADAERLMEKSGEHEPYLLASRFSYLFRGRTDYWGAIHGEAVEGTVTPALWINHLWGDGSIGVYPLVRTQAGMRCAWGCTDIDDGYDKSLPLAKNVHRALKLLGVSSWVERTKGKGFHIWLLIDGWADAANVRNVLLLAHQVAGVTSTEINPKQVVLKDGTARLGNYVNAPFALQHASVGRRVVLDPDTWEPLQLVDFVERAHATLNLPVTLAQVAQQYIAPPPPQRAHIDSYDGVVDKALTGKLSGLAWTIFQGGPLDGRDRSGTLMRLAHLMAESGVLTTGEAVALLGDADVRWGRFIEEGRAYLLDDMVAKAFGKAQTSD